MASVLIAHSYPAVCAGLEGALARAQGIEVVAKASRGEDTLRLTERLRPDVVLLDCRLAGALDGIAVAERILAAGWRVRVLALSAPGDDGPVYRLWQAGAVGCIPERAELMSIMQAVAVVAGGERLWTPEQIARARWWQEDIGSRLEALTQRERHVLMMIAEALSDRQVAERFSLSRNIARWHARNILSKLRPKTRHEAAACFLEALGRGWKAYNHQL